MPISKATLLCITFAAIPGALAPAQTQKVYASSGALDAGDFPGADIGAKVNAAIAQLAGACGAVRIDSGTYSFSTQIIKPRCVRLEGNNSTLSWAVGDSVTPAIVVGSVSSADYTQGGVSNIHLSGNGTGAVGIWLGGKGASPYNVPAGLSDFLETFSNVNVSGFQIGWGIGYNAYQDIWVGSSATNNQEGIEVVVPFGSENMNFHGFQCLNSSDRCFYAPDMLGATYNFISSSFDYNTNGAFYTMNGDLHLLGGHLEQSNNAIPFDEPDVDGVKTLSGMRVSIGGSMNIVLSGATLPGIVRVFGWNSQVIIDSGSMVYAPNSTISSFVNWGGEGASGDARVGQYWNPTSINGINFPALSLITSAAPSGGRQAPAYQDLPVFGQYAQTDHYETKATIASATIDAQTGSGFIGAANNLNGQFPSTTPGTPLPYNGNFLAWNAEDHGEADYFNPYNAANTTDTGHSFYVNNYGAWNKIGGFTRGAQVFAPNGVYGGYTGTKFLSGCNVTFTGGVVTNITGC